MEHVRAAHSAVHALHDVTSDYAATARRVADTAYYAEKASFWGSIALGGVSTVVQQTTKKAAVYAGARYAAAQAAGYAVDRYVVNPALDALVEEMELNPHAVQFTLLAAQVYRLGRSAAKSPQASGDKSVSVPRTAQSSAVPHGDTYSVAAQARLSSASYPGVSRARHYQESNESLLRMMEADPHMAQAMRSMGINLQSTPTGLAPRQPPAGWSWHHAQEPGVMQLVPRPQHTPGSIFWDTLHPGGQGGYAIWGK